MIGRLAVVTDSAAYLPDVVRRRFGVHVVPLTVTLDGRSYLEERELDADAFYRLLKTATSVNTSQPAPGQLLEAYRQAAADGAEAVLSIHIAESMSGTVQSARLAAELAPLPVMVVDTGQASFAEGLVVWSVLDAMAGGTPVSEAPAVAARASAQVGNTFVVKALGLLRAGGRLEPGARADAIPVLALEGGAVRVTGNAGTVDEAVGLMADVIRAAAGHAAGGLRVGIGHGAAEAIACELLRRVRGIDGVRDVIEYVVGPSIGAHTGAGTAGAVWIDLGRA